jgi:ribosomal protein L12E/L44/L45/RPP1/RPP2
MSFSTVFYQKRLSIMNRDFLTSERLKALFKSNFELANYAMRLARYKIMAGHEVNVDELLDEVQAHPHRYSIEELDKMGAEAKEKRQEAAAQERQERHQERTERNQERR